jgi:hypothetical protein
MAAWKCFSASSQRDIVVASMPRRKSGLQDVGEYPGGSRGTRVMQHHPYGLAGASASFQTSRIQSTAYSFIPILTPTNKGPCQSGKSHFPICLHSMADCMLIGKLLAISDCHTMRMKCSKGQVVSSGRPTWPWDTSTLRPDGQSRPGRRITLPARSSSGSSEGAETRAPHLPGHLAADPTPLQLERVLLGQRRSKRRLRLCLALPP